MKLTLVAKDNISMIWSNMEDAFAEAIETHGQELSLSVMKDELSRGEAQLWLCAVEMQIFGWAITSIVNYGEVRRLRFLLLGGFDMELWLQNIDAIEQWALKYHGITEAEAWVRPGLRKKLMPFGYEKAYEIVTKKIEKRVTE